MPTAPTFTSVTAQTGFIQISYANVGAGDHNQIWRYCADEYGGLFIKIADSLPWLVGALLFNDFAVASGKGYAYFLVAVDSGGITAASATKSMSLTLSSGWLHSVTKTDTTSGTASNAVSSMSLLDLIPHTRQYGLASASYLLANATTPTVAVGNIEEIGVGLTNRVPNTVDSNRQTLRDIYESRRYVCFRDTRGNKFFGQLVYNEQYQATYTDLSIGFLVRDFTEAL